MKKISGLLCLLLILVIMSGPAGAATIFESATLGATGQTSGWSVSSGQFLGVRFEITSTVTTESIGGHFYEDFERPFFAAVVKLTGFSDFPDSSDLSTPDVLGVTLINTPSTSDEVQADLTLTLEPGIYTLIFGSGLFGATGHGAAPSNNTDIGNPSYFYGTSSWWEDYEFQNLRFFLNGSTKPYPMPWIPLLLLDD